MQEPTRPSRRPAPALRRHLSKRLDPHRRPRRHGGAQPLAATMRDLIAIIECQATASSSACAPATSTSGADLGRPRSSIARLRRGQTVSIVGSLGNAARTSCRPGLARRFQRKARHRDRPDERARPGERLPADGLDPRRAEATRPTPKRSPRRRREELRRARAGDARLPGHGHPTVDYGNNIRQVAQDRRDRRVRTSRLRAGLHPPCSARQGPFRWAALSGDPEDIRKTDGKMKEPSRGRAPAPLARHGAASASRSGPCRRGSAGSASASGARGPRVQRDGEAGG